MSFLDSMYAAVICLGTIQARTHVQLAPACQQSMIRAQHRLRLTMQHVFGHGGILGNECADHAAALGTCGLISSHNVTSRWVRHTVDSDGYSMVATVSVKHLNDFSIFGQTLLLFIRTENSIGSHGSHLLSAFCFCFRWFIAFPTSDGSNFFIRVYCIEHWRFLRAQYVESSIGIAFPQACEWYCRLLPCGPRPGQDRTLLSLCS